MGIQIEGAAAVNAALDAYITDVHDAINTEIQAAGIECQAEAKKACPVDTGRLRASIVYGSGILEATVGTNVEYGPFIEHGTRKMRAQPFLFPAFEAASQHLQDNLSKL